MYRKYFKRPLDFILALVALIVLSPVMLMVAILVRIKLGSPVIFKQQRPGLNEKIFTMYKFRTMTDERDEKGNLLPDEKRLTSFGKLLRSTSLDELPELWNILKGDMSFVGPRPQLVKDMVFMTPRQRRRHLVRPGLTGLAQVNGRNKISWEDKLSLDLEYIELSSFRLDIRIIGETFIKVLGRDGVATDGMDTSEDFGDYLLRIGSIDRQYYLQQIHESDKLLTRARDSS